MYIRCIAKTAPEEKTPCQVVNDTGYRMKQNFTHGKSKNNFSNVHRKS